MNNIFTIRIFYNPHHNSPNPNSA